MPDTPRSVNLLKKGTVYRGDSYISEDVVQVRFGALFDDGFITKRKESSTSNNNKVWPLHSKCALTKIESKKLTVIKNSHTLLSLAYGGYNSRKLHSFKLTWPSSGVLSKDTLLLGFESAEEARSWHQAFQAAIAALHVTEKTIKHKSLKRDLKHRGVSHDFSGDPTDFSGHHAADFSGDAGEIACEWASVEDPSEERDDAVGGGGDALAQQRIALAEKSSADNEEATSASWLLHHDGEDEDDEDNFHEAPLEAPLLRGPSRSRTDRLTTDSDVIPVSMPSGDHSGTHPKSWTPYRVLNGLAVYKEEEDVAGNGGAYMVSGTMRSTPVACWEALMDTSFGRSNIWALSSIEPVEEIDKHSHIFRAVMQPQGTMQKFLAPRELVVNRVWRRDEDGTYNVLLQSVEHPDCHPTPGMVTAHIGAMGFTIAPLKMRKEPDGTSLAADQDVDVRSPRRRRKLDASAAAECLVTVVLKVDLGGCFARNSWSRRLLMFIDSWERWWVESLLMTVVALRDKVEQDRFVVRPFSIRMGPMLQKSPSIERAQAQPPSLAVRSHLTAYSQNEASLGSLPETSQNSPHLATAGVLSAEDVWKLSQQAPESALRSQHLPMPEAILDAKYWSCPGASGFKVRGPDYLKDRKKIPSAPPVFSLQGVELVKMPLKDTVYHVSRYLPIVRHSTAPFNFVMCLTLPYSGQTLGLVLVFSADAIPSPISAGASDDSADDEVLPPFDLNLARFLAGTDKLRDLKLKLVPSLAEGSWVVRQAVGQTPVMLGKRLKSVYYQENGYVEVDIDIGANSTAAHITSLVAGAIKSLVFDIGIVIEGHTTDELPERLLGSVRLDHLDLSAAMQLDTTKELQQVARDRPRAAS